MGQKVSDQRERAKAASRSDNGVSRVSRPRRKIRRR